MKTFTLLLVILILGFSALSAISWPISQTSNPDDIKLPYGPVNLGTADSLHYYFNHGFDLVAEVGTQVYATHSGIVAQSYDSTETEGNAIYLIDTEDAENYNYKTVYRHLDTRLVENGDQVVEGETQLGTTGQSGSAISPKLYFELRNFQDSDLHPLELLDYADVSETEIEMVNYDDNNFSFNLVVSGEELDVERMKIRLDWYDFSPTYATTQNYVIDYGQKENIPLGSINSIFIESDMGNDAWKMYVAPQVYTTGQEQVVNFRFNSNGADLHATRLEVWVYNAYDPVDHDGHFLTYDLTETSSGEDIVGAGGDLLLPNYPNPFNPNTIISFSLNNESTENTEIVIYNTKGQKVKRIPVILSGVEGDRNQTYSVTWNGRDESNQPVSSGIYLYQLKRGNRIVQQRKMTLLK